MNISRPLRLVKLPLTTLAVVALMLPGAQIDASEKLQELASANTDFAFNLLMELSKEKPHENIFISPFSVSAILQMMCNGAKGKTLDEMNRVLGTTGLDSGARNAAAKEILQSINGQNTNVILSTANAIWIRKGISVSPSFNSCNAQYFGSTIGTLDLSSPQAIGAINAWVQEKTHGKISSILDQPLDRQDALFLANAVYFKGNWLDQFHKELTKERDFHLLGGGLKKLPLMEKYSSGFVYHRSTGYQAVRLAYKDANLGMYIFLPDFGSSVDELLKTITSDRWKRVTRPGFERREGFLMLPRFTLRHEVRLNESLKALGIRRAFDLGEEFIGIAPGPVWISWILQKAFVDVNEEGTEAAAVTGAAVGYGGLREPLPKPFQMIVDRPFFFLIHDGRTDSILFMGVVYDPGAPS